MKRFTAAASFALVAALSPGPASAVVTNFHYHKWIPSGRKGLIGTSGELDQDCRLVQAKEPTVVNAPQHGRLLFAQGSDFPKFNLANPHYKCSFVKVRGIKIFYLSSPGFRGTDQFTIEDFGSNGDVNVSAFDITVQ